MSGQVVLKQAWTDGLKITLTPEGEIRARGAQPEIAKWTPVLRLHKPEIIALLQSAQAAIAPWDAGDWQAYFHERAAVAEFEGALTRQQAERQASRCCVAEWLCRNPVTSEPGQCAWCGRGDLTGRAATPYGDEAHGHTWLHGECWTAWYAQRRQAAVEALAGYGITGEAFR